MQSSLAAHPEPEGELLVWLDDLGRIVNSSEGNLWRKDRMTTRSFGLTGQRPSPS